MLPKVSHSAYDTAKIEHLQKIIQSAHDRGQSMDYEILMDGFKIIPRTSDPSIFLTFGHFINAKTKLIEIYLFKGASGNAERYFFHMEEKELEQALSGIKNPQSKEWEEEKLKQIKKNFDHGNLQEDYDALLLDIETKEKKIRELEGQIEKTKDGQNITFSQFGTALLQGLMQHPKVKQTIDNFSNLAGVPTNQNAAPQNSKEEQASFSRKEETENAETENEKTETVTLTEDEKRYLKLIDDLNNLLTEEELVKVMTILDLVAHNKQSIAYTLKMTQNFLKDKTKKEDEKV